MNFMNYKGNMNLKMTEFSDIDQFDRKIMSHLSADARMTISDLAAKVGLSKSPCHARVKRLERLGFILGYAARLDPVKLGLDHIAFVEVKLSDTRAEALRRFNQAIMDVSEIEQCHMIAGGFDYLLKVRTSSIKDYRRILAEDISNLPHVAQTSTFVSMEAVKEQVSISKF